MHAIALRLCRENGFEPRILCECDQVDTVLGFVASGNGIGFVSSQSLMMRPLGFAPMFYGVLLESLSARKIVRTALLLLGLLELVFCCTNSYVLLLVIRGLQGMAIPAILTSLVIALFGFKQIKESTEQPMLTSVSV